MKGQWICYLVMIGVMVACHPPAVTATKVPTPRDGANYCGRGDENLGSCSDVCNGICTQGLGGINGQYLEGRGLEGTQFVLVPSSASSIFPPTPGEQLQDVAGCDKNEALQFTILNCQPGTTARACQASIKKRGNRDICGVHNNAQAGQAITVGVAIVQGYWDQSGAWHLQLDGQPIVTVSCNAEASPDETQTIAADGAVARCSKDHRFQPDGDNAALTTCIRMQRADYCGDGTAHTYLGTNIDVFAPADAPKRSVGVKDTGTSWDDCADGRCLEATWGPQGALCVAHSRWADLPFDRTKCPSGTTFPVVIPAQNKQNGDGNIYCRGDAPTANDLFTRSRQRKCGQKPTDCSSSTSLDADCPGCASAPPKRDHAVQGRKKP